MKKIHQTATSGIPQWGCTEKSPGKRRGPGPTRHGEGQLLKKCGAARLKGLFRNTCYAVTIKKGGCNFLPLSGPLQPNPLDLARVAARSKASSRAPSPTGTSSHPNFELRNSLKPVGWYVQGHRKPSAKTKAHKHMFWPVTVRWGVVSWSGVQGSKIYVLSSEPKEH